MTNVVFEGCRNYGNIKFPNRKYRPVTSNVGNHIWKFGVLKSTSKNGESDVTNRKSNLIGKFVLFCSTF